MYRKMMKATAPLVFMVVGLITALPVKADSTALIIKFGTFVLSDDSQSLGPARILFDENADNVLGAEIEWRQRDGLALGGELLAYRNEWLSSISGNGDNDTLVLLFNVKKYFNNSEPFQPYIGAGIGGATVDFNGPGGDASGSDVALAVMAGAELRLGNQFGLHAEAKYLASKPEDENGDTIDVSGLGLFVGLSVHF